MRNNTAPRTAPCATHRANRHNALQLNRQPQAIVDYSKGSAKTYNENAHEKYYGISSIARLPHTPLKQSGTATPEDTQAFDVGYSTDLPAPALHSHGLQQLDGIDLRQPLPAHLAQRYDAAIVMHTTG